MKGHPDAPQYTREDWRYNFTCAPSFTFNLLAREVTVDTFFALVDGEGWFRLGNVCVQLEHCVLDREGVESAIAGYLNTIARHIHAELRGLSDEEKQQIAKDGHQYQHQNTVCFELPQAVCNLNASF